MKTFSLALCAVAAMGVTAAQAQKINAAGATFPAPIYQKWFGEYHTAHSDVEINYQAVGSGAGIKQLTDGTVDFGASDMPMTNEQIAAVKVKPLHFPTVMGDGSGTTFVFTDYLSKISPEWKMKVGANTSVSWPGQTLGGNGNAGVAGLLKQTPNSIGYVELLYAEQNKMPYASIKNSAGNFVKPSLDSVTEAAAAAAKDMPEDFRVSTFTWMLIPSQIPDANKAKAIKSFLEWMLADGQKGVASLTYAPLPKEVVAKEVKQIAMVK